MGYPRVSPMFSGLHGASGARGDPPHPDSLIVESAIGEVAALTPAPLPNGRGVEAALVFGLGFGGLDAQGALDAALANVKNLLLVHGRLHSRPLIRMEPSPVRAKLAENGKPGVWRREEWAEPTWQDHAPDFSRTAEVAVRAKRKNSYPSGAYCKLEYEPDPQTVVNERAEYLVWRAGLAALAERLHEAGLTAYTALPPAAAQRPWMGDVDGAAIADLFRPGAEGVYAGEEARALAAERRTGRRRPVHGGATYRGRAVKPLRSVEEGWK